MSFLDTLFGWLAPRVPAPLQPSEVPAADAPPKIGEATGSQAGGVGGLSAGGYGGVPCYATPWAGTFDTYREIITDGTLALVRSIVFNEVLSSSWSVEADEGVPDDRKELVETLIKHRIPILRHALTAMDVEAAPFEPIWDTKGGQTIIERFKPLDRDKVTFRALPSGEIAGFDARGIDGRVAELRGPNAFVHINEPTPARPLGRSRLENVRETVWNWRETAKRIERLGNKESGSVIKVSRPPDQTGTNARDSAGAATTNRAKSEAFAQSIQSGSAWIAVDNALAALKPHERDSATVDQIIKLIEMDLWRVENVQMGGNGKSIDALIAYCQYLDVQKVRGYLRPERSVLEGQHGTKAEAGVVSDTGTTDSERVEADIVESLNCGPVADLLRFNFGDDAVGTVRIVAHPLRDVQEAIDSEIIKDLFSNAATADEVYRNYDVDEIMERRGVHKRKTPLPPPVPVTEPPPVGAPGMNGKPVNGNGKANGVKLAASRLALSRRLFEKDGK